MFTSEQECKVRTAFLYVLLTMGMDWLIRWGSRYISFTLYLWYAKKTPVCSTETIEEKLQGLSDTLSENRYNRKFISKFMATIVRMREVQTINKKSLFMSQQFRGNTDNKLLIQSIRRTIERTFNPRKLWLVFFTPPMMILRLKDELPRMSTLFCIY